MTITDTRPDIGQLEGYASTFGNVDRQGDVVLPGAFRQVTDDINRGRVSVPIVAAPDCGGHGCSGNPRDVVGSIVEAREDDHGWWIRASFAADADSQLLRQKTRSGALSLSIGYAIRPDGKRFGTCHGQRVRFLRDLDIQHVAITPVPANPQARITGVKYWLADHVAPLWRPRPDSPEVARCREIARSLRLNLAEGVFEGAQFYELTRQLDQETDRAIVSQAAVATARNMRAWGLT